MLRQSLLVRYFNGGTVGTGLNTDSSSDSGLEMSDRDGDNGSNNGTDEDEDKSNDVVSAKTIGRLKGVAAATVDPLIKTTITNQQQPQHLPPSQSTTWSPPPPISFRTELLQQQHRVTHGPGGECRLICLIGSTIS